MNANTDYEKLFDYDVIDSTGARIGAVDHLWLDHATGMPKYVGARTGWLLSHSYVLPFSAVQTDDEHRAIRLPYTADFVQHAPSLSNTADLTPDDEQKLSAYYGSVPGSGANLAPPGNTAAAGNFSPAPAPIPPSAVAQSPVAPNSVPASSVPASSVPPMAPPPAPVPPMPVPPPSIASTAPAATPLAQAPSAPGSPGITEAGRVQLRKVVRTERIYVPVEVQREYVESVPSAPGQSAAPVASAAPQSAGDPQQNQAPAGMARQNDPGSTAPNEGAVRDDRIR